MTQKGYKRIMIACVTFETVKIVKPINSIDADKVYLLHMGDEEPYRDFFNEVMRQIEELEIPCEPIEMKILDFPSVMKVLLRIIRTENKKGNHVYINISSGSRIFSSAALIVCMQEDGIPFDVHTDEYKKHWKEFFDEEGRPVGLSTRVGEPVYMPQFKLKPPNNKLIKGLQCWKEVESAEGRFNQNKVIIRLHGAGLMEDIYKKDVTGNTKVSPGAKMRLQRTFIPAWIAEGWFEKKERGKYVITPWGEEILNIYEDLPN